jgi:FKBP-type peptidyl-prolyl cis-trans isomerase (trigger factor)
MSSKSKVTTDHKEIQKWVEERGGRPATVKGTGGKDESGGLLRIDYEGFGDDENLEPISWEDFFEKFEESNLAFLYQEETKGGDTSRFSKFVRRDENN